MAENSYNPFSGFSKKTNEKKGLGQKLKSVDWDSLKTKSDWVVFDSKKVASLKKPDIESEKIETISDEEVNAWREKHSVTVFGDNCPNPITEFKMLHMLPPYIQKKFEVQGFKNPTTIQAQSWPILFQSRDLVGIAKTGSGKTLAFIIPAIAHIAVQQQLRPGDGPIVVVLAPTRELAQQIETETNKVVPSTMKCACIYGGSPKGPQIQILQNGVHILIATPGRLIDLLEIKRINLLRCTYLVLDEADRMLDMGFEPQVRTICSQIRPDRQTLMFSATWPQEIQSLAASFQRSFIRINIGSTELLANPDVSQHFIFVPEKGKFLELKKLMFANRSKRVLVFCKTKKTADFLERQLKNNGIEAFAIHGDKEQKQREYILDKLRREMGVNVVATDIAARGLDVKNLEVVINYDFPMQIDDYVHRIGRTGRAGAKGDSYTFISKTEQQMSPQVVHDLVKIIEKANQSVPHFLAEWAGERRVSAIKRPRDGFSSKKAPSLHYSHRSNVSGEQSQTVATKEVFQNRDDSKYTRFAESDDD